MPVHVNDFRKMYGKKVQIGVETDAMPVVCALEVLLIDEISMLSGEFLHWMDYFFRDMRQYDYSGQARNCDKTKPFGGMQIVARQSPPAAP